MIQSVRSAYGHVSRYGLHRERSATKIGGIVTWIFFSDGKMCLDLVGPCECSVQPSFSLCYEESRTEKLTYHWLLLPWWSQRSIVRLPIHVFEAVAWITRLEETKTRSTKFPWEIYSIPAQILTLIQTQINYLSSEWETVPRSTGVISEWTGRTEAASASRWESSVVSIWDSHSRRRRTERSRVTRSESRSVSTWNTHKQNIQM